jgi:transposase
MAFVIVGVDGHKATLACCLVDEIGRECAAATFANDADGHQALVAWALEAAAGCEVEFAVESAYGFPRRLVERLVDNGRVVFDIAAKLVERGRRRRGLGKSDVLDAREIARAALREHAKLVALTPTPAYVRDLKLLVQYYGQLSRERTQTANRLHAALTALLPGYQRRARNLVSKKSQNAIELALEALPESVAVRLALGRLVRVRELDRELVAARRLICFALERSQTRLEELVGVGPLTAARILAEVRDVRRFRSPDAFARANGTAPIPASSGQRSGHHRLNRGGNRRLNYALHMMAIVQVRCDPRARAYIERQRAAGKTYRDALRCLKRRLSDVVWRQLVADLAAGD